MQNEIGPETALISFEEIHLYGRIIYRPDIQQYSTKLSLYLTPLSLFNYRALQVPPPVIEYVTNNQGI